MNIVVDYGNSSAKVGIFSEHKLIERHVFHDPAALKAFLESKDAAHILISSVSQPAADVASWASHATRRYILDRTLPLPIINGYATPATLGVDRIAAACGAWALFPHTPSLTLDAGTCITYEFIDASGRYHGGGIAPGLNMRFEAMHAFTARLPRVHITENPPLIGNSTETCMQSGAIHGMAREMDGIIASYRAEYSGLQAILCGGDGPFFENKLKEPIFASPDLVLIGLNHILQHNLGA
jgi:type III pantothenate kinase